MELLKNRIACSIYGALLCSVGIEFRYTYGPKAMR